MQSTGSCGKRDCEKVHAINITVRCRQSMDMSGPWLFCWARGLTVNADDKFSNLDYQPTAFWRHLCDDASRRQWAAPSERQKADAAQSRATQGIPRGSAKCL